jgi:hypothetical protein
LFRAGFAAILALLLAGCGLTAPRGSEGFANLDSLGLTDTDLVMSLSLGPAVLRFAASHLDDDPEARSLLQDLDGVRIRIYEVDGDAGRVAARMARMSDRLQADGWQPVLLVRKEDEQAHMLLRVVDGRIHGMTVLVLEDDTEAVVINLMGDIRPESFGDVMVAMDVDSPGVDRVEVAAAPGG